MALKMESFYCSWSFKTPFFENVISSLSSTKTLTCWSSQIASKPLFIFKICLTFCYSSTSIVCNRVWYSNIYICVFVANNILLQARISCWMTTPLVIFSKACSSTYHWLAAYLRDLTKLVLPLFQQTERVRFYLLSTLMPSKCGMYP